MTYSVGYFIISQKTHSSECVSRNDDISTMYMENGGRGEAWGAWCLMITRIFLGWEEVRVNIAGWLKKWNGIMTQSLFVVMENCTGHPLCVSCEQLSPLLEYFLLVHSWMTIAPLIFQSGLSTWGKEIFTLIDRFKIKRIISECTLDEKRNILKNTTSFLRISHYNIKFSRSLWLHNLW